VACLSSLCSCVDGGLQLASLLGMRYKPCLSQNEHWLVLKCALPLEVCGDSSSQHGKSAMQEPTHISFEQLSKCQVQFGYH
jgi:hypothetical protein